MSFLDRRGEPTTWWYLIMALILFGMPPLLIWASRAAAEVG